MSASNVLLVTIDSLRADYFPDEEAAPRLTELSERGTNFTQAVANGPNTKSSFPSILTGTHAGMYGGNDYMSEERPFLSATLRDDGFTTVGYHSNPHLGLEHNYNYGFEVFNDGMEKGDDEAGHSNAPVTLDGVIKKVHRTLDSDSFLYKVLRRGWHLFSSTTGTTKYTPAKSLTNKSLDWLEENEGDPFFMWLHFMDVHYPFHPPDRYMEELGYDPPSARRVAKLNGAMHENPESLSESDKDDLIALYRGELRYVDDQIGRVLDRLDETGSLDETVVVATADHGEAFGEHDRWGHHPFMYDELLRVPLVVDDPGREPDTIERQVSLIDLFPTICDSVGVSTPAKVQGDSLYDPDADEIALATSGGGSKLACRTPRWKCFWFENGDRIELYDLDADPDETTDVSDDHPEVVEELRGHIDELRSESAETATQTPQVDESEEMKARLRALGYTEE